MEKTSSQRQEHVVKQLLYVATLFPTQLLLERKTYSVHLLILLYKYLFNKESVLISLNQYLFELKIIYDYTLSILTLNIYNQCFYRDLFSFFF